MSFFDTRLQTPDEIRRGIGQRARELRIARSTTQSELARAAGVMQATVSRFESTGRIGVEGLVKIAIALRAEATLSELFALPRTRTIDEIVRARATEAKTRRRVRHRK